MAKINIYFQDLNEQAQSELWEAVREEPEAENEGQPNNEEIDDHINRNNFANEFVV